MRKTLLAILIVLAFISINAELHHQFYIGYTNTTMSGEHFKNWKNSTNSTMPSFRGLELGGTFYKKFDSNMTIGLNWGYTERGWEIDYKTLIGNEPSYHSIKNCYWFQAPRIGYEFPEYFFLTFHPYIGFDMLYVLNSSHPSKYHQGSYALALGLDILLTEKLVVCLKYSIGLTDVMKGDDTKYNTLRTAIGFRF